MAKRVSRVNELIKEEIAKIIFRELDLSPDILVTVTRVETSVDLEDSSVFISVWPGDKLQIVVDILNKMIYSLQQKLNRKLRMRPIPKIKFLKEKLTVEAGEIEGILEQLKNKAT
ncbi:MAG: 30S ribosome-binding factor RbfA [bacterium]